MSECVRAMTVAARNHVWSDEGLEFPDGYIEAVQEAMEDFAPCARWDPKRSELHACLTHAPALAEEVDRRHFDEGLIGPDAWLDDHQVEGLWDAHRADPGDPDA